MDKLKHFVVSFVLTVVLTLFLPLVIAVEITFVVGLSKEVCDYVTKKGTPELLDIIADILGIGLAVIIAS